MGKEAKGKKPKEGNGNTVVVHDFKDLGEARQQRMEEQGSQLAQLRASCRALLEGMGDALSATPDGKVARFWAEFKTLRRMESARKEITALAGDDEDLKALAAMSVEGCEEDISEISESIAKMKEEDPQISIRAMSFGNLIKNKFPEAKEAFDHLSGSSTKEEVSAFITKAREAMVMDEDPKGPIVFGHKKSERRLSFNRVVLSAVEGGDEFAGSVEKYFAEWQEKAETKTKARTEAVKDFLLGDVKPDAKNFMEFFDDGKGNRLLVFVPRAKGNVLVERTDGGFVCRKADTVDACESFFCSYDRKRGRFVPKGEIRFTAEQASSGFHPATLYFAVREQLQKEKKRRARREEAQNIRSGKTVSGLRITAYELSAGEEGTVVISAPEWQSGDRKITVDCLVKLKDGNVGLADSVSGAVENVTIIKWLSEPKPLDEALKNGSFKKLLALNEEHDRDWLLGDLAARHGAVFLTKKNGGDLLDIPGKDGKYAVAVTWFLSGNKRGYLGYVFQKEGINLKVLGASPGRSDEVVNLLTQGEEADREDDSREAVVLGKWYPMDDLPRMLRAVLRSLQSALYSKKGEKAEVPEHLEPPPKEEKEENENSGKVPPQYADPEFEEEQRRLAAEHLAGAKEDEREEPDTSDESRKASPSSLLEATRTRSSVLSLK